MFYQAGLQDTLFALLRVPDDAMQMQQQSVADLSSCKMYSTD